jgi:hypothetical protein
MHPRLALAVWLCLYTTGLVASYSTTCTSPTPTDQPRGQRVYEPNHRIGMLPPELGQPRTNLANTTHTNILWLVLGLSGTIALLTALPRQATHYNNDHVLRATAAFGRRFVTMWAIELGRRLGNPSATSILPPLTRTARRHHDRVTAVLGRHRRHHIRHAPGHGYIQPRHRYLVRSPAAIYHHHTAWVRLAAAFHHLRRVAGLSHNRSRTTARLVALQRAQEVPDATTPRTPAPTTTTPTSSPSDAPTQVGRLKDATSGLLVSE